MTALEIAVLTLLVGKVVRERGREDEGLMCSWGSIGGYDMEEELVVGINVVLCMKVGSEPGSGCKGMILGDGGGLAAC